MAGVCSGWWGLFGQQVDGRLPDTPAGGEQQSNSGDTECGIPEFSGAESFVGDMTAEVDGRVAQHGQHGGLCQSGDFDEFDGFGEEEEGDDADEWQQCGDPLHEFGALSAFVIGGAEPDDSAEVGDHAGITGVGDEECGVENGEGADQEQPAGVFPEDWYVAA